LCFVAHSDDEEEESVEEDYDDYDYDDYDDESENSSDSDSDSESEVDDSGGRSKSRRKPRPVIVGGQPWVDIDCVVTRVSTKPFVGTIIVSVDVDSNIVVCNELYQESGATFEFSGASRNAHGAEVTHRGSVAARESQDSESAGDMVYSPQIFVSCIYEDENTIRVVGGGDNAIVVWEIWNQEKGFYDGDALYIALPPPMPKKEALMEKRMYEALKKAKAQKKAGSKESLEVLKKRAEAVALADILDADDEEITTEIYGLSCFQYPSQAGGYGVAVVGREDGFVSYINMISNAPFYTASCLIVGLVKLELHCTI